MNYLSHYIVDHQPGNPYFNTGLILPDMARGLVGSFTASPELRSVTEWTSLHEGCKRHLHSDKHFHSSTFFTRFHDAVKLAMQETAFSPSLNRKWFLAHILTELLIDRMFVKHQPEWADLFYNDLLETDLQILSSFLSQFGLSDNHRFEQRFEHFRQVQFIRYYTDNNKFIYSLNRIMIRIGEPELNMNDTEKMTELFTRLEAQHFADAPPILQQLKQIHA